MFMIDRVKLDAIYHVPNIRGLNDRHAVVFQQKRQPAHESIKVRDVGEDVVRMNNVSALSLSAQSSRELSSKELTGRRNPAFFRDASDIASRFDAQHGNPGVLVKLKKVAF